MNQKPSAHHHEPHLVQRTGWLRAAVLGANDGIVSTSSLILGVASAASDHGNILLAGVAGMVAGAMSMAAGEYVSVSSQSDTERADLARESRELARNPEGELQELADIYAARGVDPALAREVAVQLSRKDALAAHAHDELGISDMTAARPVQAALASAAAFTAGGILPIITTILCPGAYLVPVVTAASLGFLALLGAVGAKTGGAAMLPGIVRVTFWGAMAMALTYWVGSLFGAAI